MGQSVRRRVGIAAATLLASSTGLTGAALVLTSTVATAATTLPDLQVTSVASSPTSPAPGAAVTFSAVVKNAGAAATPAGTVVGVNFKIDGHSVSWSDSSTTSLGAGASETLTANSGPTGSSTWTAVAGIHTLTTTVDDVNRIPESNETNNVLTSTVSVPVPGGPVSAPTPPAASMGTYSSCALIAGGKVTCWGTYSLGDGTNTPELSPKTTVAGITTAIQVANGQDHACALLANTTVKCWGINEDGQLGNDTESSSTVPVSVPGLVNVASITAGQFFSCALLRSGTAECWGVDSHGELGDGDATGAYNVFTPVPVAGLTNAVSISSGAFDTCARIQGGTVKCWGDGYEGELGNGTYYTQNPDCYCSAGAVQVTGLTNVVQVSISAFDACALTSAGKAYCWGDGMLGALGNGSTANSATPIQVPGIGRTLEVAAGGSGACVLLDTGTASCWGSNNHGQLGDGTTTDRSTAAVVPGLTNVKSLVPGPADYCAVLGDGTVKCWGWNQFGTLGNGTTTDQHTPVSVVGLTLPTTPLPDLVVSAVTASPSAPAAGAPVTFSATVTNTGTAATAAGTTVGVSFFLDGHTVSWSDTSTTSLAPGQSRTLTANSGPTGSATWAATAGTHSVSAVADDVDRIPELDETDNVAFATVNVS